MRPNAVVEAARVRSVGDSDSAPLAAAPTSGTNPSSGHRPGVAGGAARKATNVSGRAELSSPAYGRSPKSPPQQKASASGFRDAHEPSSRLPRSVGTRVRRKVESRQPGATRPAAEPSRSSTSEILAITHVTQRNDAVSAPRARARTDLRLLHVDDEECLRQHPGPMISSSAESVRVFGLYLFNGPI